MVQAAVEAMLRQRIGLDADSIGSRTIARLIDRRCAACGLPDQAAYWRYLQTSPQEWDALIEAVVVPETWFFRDKEPFVCLTSYVKSEWLAAPKRLRVLSVPCSTGEEPYSIAMTLLNAGLTAQFSIDAIDISHQALLKAKQAVYSSRSFRGDRLDIDRYFQEVADGRQVRSFVRDRVTFKQANILQPGLFVPGSYQVIFCRNLLIYLDQSARDRVMQALDRALAPEGLLFVGSAETAQIPAPPYKAIPHAFAFAYQKVPPQVAPASVVPPKPAPSVSLATAPTLSTPPHPPQAAANLELAQQCADRGQLIEAAQHCEAYLHQHRANANAYLLLGEIYQGLDRLDAAEQAYQKAIYLNPQAFAALTHWSLLKEQRGDRIGADLLKRRVQRLLMAQKKPFGQGLGEAE